MNCKQGDLARIVHPDEYGRLVNVLYAAPTRPYVLPDGNKALASKPGRWVCEMLGTPVQAKVYENGEFSHYRLARYVAIPDKWIRPIRGDEGTDETLLWKPVPLPQIEGQPA